ncbi:ribosomal protein S18-alanine N-acetyltransferase [Clostridium massiliodielmoense]|uniref:ribosomal protein S18-alanine N-acetyltransferase n=1 Tax=Clostridium massiliodielmoense TaxID=1776385 RepID=UPI0004D40A1C|nr:ribosomal protein S18-alanine N-acetyltransferase [Clostridium massiliodielmoense]KEH98539.1 30S ribosomal protein S18 [Clostridium botulinum C/D str. BKT12695]
MNNLVVEKMVEKHLNDVLEINNSSFSNPLSFDSLKSEFNDNSYKYLILRDTDKNIIIGYASLWFMLDEADITNIAISKDFRGNGYSHILMAKIIDICKEKKVPNITLEVRENNISAIRLYEKYGFTKEGLRKNYYGPNLNGIIMWKKDILN